MSENRKAVSVWIAGEEHHIRSNADPKYTKSCARYVDERISEIRSRAGLIETHKVAILAALSITDELQQLRDEVAKLRQETASRATNLARRIEDELAG